MGQKTIGSVVLSPFKWVFNSYPKKYMSLGTRFGPGAISSDIQENYRSAKSNKSYNLKQVDKEYKSIPTNPVRARERYLQNMERFRMTRQDRCNEFRLGLFVQWAALLTFAVLYIVSVIHHNYVDHNGNLLLILDNTVLGFSVPLLAYICSIGYLVGLWKSFSARNMMQLNPFHFLLLVILHPSELIPTQDFEDNLENNYGYKISRG